MCGGFSDGGLPEASTGSTSCVVLPVVKEFLNLYLISRPWDLSHLIGADFLSILPHRMVNIDEYVSENEFLTF